MLPSIEVHSDLRVGDLYWVFFSSSIRKLIYARWVVGIVLLFLAALGARYIRLVGILLLPPFIYILLGGLIFVALISPYLRSRSFVRATMGDSGTLSYVIGTNGIDVQREGWQVHHDWQAVRGAKQTSGLILIHVVGYAAIVIPKRCCASAQQLNDVRSIVGTYAKSKLKQRDYWP